MGRGPRGRGAEPSVADPTAWRWTSRDWMGGSSSSRGEGWDGGEDHTAEKEKGLRGRTPRRRGLADAQVRGRGTEPGRSRRDGWAAELRGRGCPETAHTGGVGRCFRDERRRRAGGKALAGAVASGDSGPPPGPGARSGAGTVAVPCGAEPVTRLTNRNEQRHRKRKLTPGRGAPGSRRSCVGTGIRARSVSAPGRPRTRRAVNPGPPGAEARVTYGQACKFRSLQSNTFQGQNATFSGSLNREGIQSNLVTANISVLRDKPPFPLTPSCRCRESAAALTPRTHRSCGRPGQGAGVSVTAREGAGAVGGTSTAQGLRTRTKVLLKETCGRGWPHSAWRRGVGGGAALTALDGVGGDLQRQRPAVGLRDVDAEDQPHARVLPPDVRLPLAELDVRVPELQDAGAVDAARNKSLCSAPDPRPIPATAHRRVFAALPRGRGGQTPTRQLSWGRGSRRRASPGSGARNPGRQSCHTLRAPEAPAPLRWARRAPRSRTGVRSKAPPAAPDTSFHLRFRRRPP